MPSPEPTIVQCSNGLLSIGDHIAYPAKRRQRLAVVEEIRVVYRVDWQGKPVERVRILVHPDDGDRYQQSVLRNPKNVVKVAQ